jgi:DNA-directed RNA polymerase beta' subunit
MNTERREIDWVNFGVFSSKEIVANSVAQITNTKISGIGSVYDERMGVGSDNSDGNCITCDLSTKECPGHFGHIELAEPIIHPRFFKIVLAYLKCFCIKCYKMLMTAEQVQLLGFNKYKRNARFDKIIERVKKVGKCLECGTNQPTKYDVSTQEKTISTTYKNKSDSISIPLSTHEILRMFDSIDDKDIETLGFNPKFIHPRNLIIQNLVVLPPCARPVVVTESNISDDDLTIQYLEIVKANIKLQSPEENSDEIKKQKNIQSLKFRIDTLFDNSQGKAKHSTGGKQLKGIKERLTGKEGQIRHNLMGKRCEQTSRTVIGPGPTLRLGEVGVPLEVVANLTVPETVNRLNKQELMDIIMAGKANFVIKKTGKRNRINLKYALYQKGTELLYNDEIVRRAKVDDEVKELRVKYVGQKDFTLKPNDRLFRNGVEMQKIVFPQKKEFKLEDGDVVERQLRKGDWVLLNRQPTLHKGSMVAHQVVPMPCKTFQFNLSITKSFNADFDGDEMNIHVGQGHEARAELINLCGAKQNIISPQSSKPNIVIVQDSLLACYLMTQPDCKKLSKEEFFNIADVAIQPNGDKISPQTILDKIQHIRKVLKVKGKKINAFNGRGIFSLALPNDFNYEFKNDANDEEPVVKIYRGVMYEGVIKNTNFAAHNSIIQLLYKEYGKDMTATFIDNVQFLTNKWLSMTGFSVGIKDCIATKTSEIEDAIEKCFMEAKGIEETTSHPGIREIRVNAALSKARDIGMRIAKNALSKNNAFLATVGGGSKGDFFNIAQITGVIGQQNLQGHRVPKHLNKGTRTLPHYPFKGMTKEMEYESRGFIRHSFIHGLNPQEFYFHAMSGREGITDTAMGTSKSGYMQRKIIKVMEDLQVKYDGTVRNPEGNIYQFAYGDDGLDPIECIFRKGEADICDVSRMVDKLNMECEAF